MPKRIERSSSAHGDRNEAAVQAVADDAALRKMIGQYVRRVRRRLRADRARGWDRTAVLPGA